jgi:glycosyltransferase involved in cell wall biosynthesis
MEPKISIIVATLNIIENGQADDFNLLISLLDRQTYPNLEIIVMDGGSSDATVEILKDYKNKGFLDFYSERDTGKYSALNKGVMRAKGKYVAFLSCDDFLHDITGLQDVVNNLEANEADFSFSPAYCRHPEGFVFLFPPTMYNAFQAMPCSRQAMVFKRSIIEKIGYFDDKFKIMSDLDLIMRLVMERAKGLYFDGNYTTYKMCAKATAEQDRANEETKLIYLKNFRNLYALNEDLLEQMVQYSKFPPALLDKLAGFFEPDDKQIFMDRCETMHQIRMQALQAQRG